MKKIPTLFERVFEGHKIVGITDKINPALEGVDISKLRPTIKVDGSCCAIINGQLFKRYDAKGKNIPAAAIPCQDLPDPVTGHFPCWVPCKADDPADRWFWEALKNTCAEIGCELSDGTYEAIGPHFQGNPYYLSVDHLYKHGSTNAIVEMTFSAIKQFLEDHYEEGLVFWDENGPVCKIKRSDFGLEWNKGGKRK